MTNLSFILVLSLGLIGSAFAEYGNLRKGEEAAPNNSTLKFCSYQATCR